MSREIDLTGESDSEIDIEYVENDYEEIRDDTLRPPPPNTKRPCEYRVERILNTKLSAAGRLYMVKWFGYPVAEATWVAERNMQCDEALEYFNSTR